MSAIIMDYERRPETCENPICVRNKEIQLSIREYVELMHINGDKFLPEIHNHMMRVSLFWDCCAVGLRALTLIDSYPPPWALPVDLLALVKEMDLSGHGGMEFVCSVPWELYDEVDQSMEMNDNEVEDLRSSLISERADLVRAMSHVNLGADVEKMIAEMSIWEHMSTKIPELDQQRLVTYLLTARKAYVKLLLI